MKALFAHDHRFISVDGAVWSESQFESTLWQRYLAHFEGITVVARMGTIPERKSMAQLERSSAPGVTFDLFPNLSSLRGLIVDRRAARQRMHALVAAHDAVIARLPSEMGLLAIAAARAEDKPWAVEVAGCPWDGLWNYGSVSGRLYAPIARLRMQRAVAQADHTLYVTRQFLQSRYPSQAANTVAASNVVLPDVPETALNARLARIEKLRNQPVRLGLIGTLRGRFKGVQTLLAALAHIRGNLPPVSVHVLGGGDPAPWREEARRMGVDDLMHFEGTLPAGEPVLQWLDDIDVYLQPSLKEGLPRALIEAMSRGCPAIASTVAGIPELLPAEDLMRPGDKKALAALLTNRIADCNWMTASARRNWTEAWDYRAEVLEARRYRFWMSFATSTTHRDPPPMD